RRHKTDMRIGIFDSGIGGLTVLHRAVKSLPEEEYIFYADTEHAPYGIKDKAEIIGYSEAAVDFLIKKDCNIVLIACNTATSVAAGILREEHDLPILGIEPAVKPAVEHGGGKRILVIATPLTIREEKLHRLVDQVDEHHLVDLKALPKLVEFAQAGEFESEAVKRYLHEELEGLHPAEYECVVLGCTHFNHFKTAIREMFGEDCAIIDGSEGTVRNLVATVRKKEFLSAGDLKIEYYESGKRVMEQEKLGFYQMLLKRLDKMDPC
ncbi:MAG: glutamate racemase, partial [Lachnospiraceae bacterium]|nr:glutamate racemase [Lachnospiraceae bacterium]